MSRAGGAESSHSPPPANPLRSSAGVQGGRPRRKDVRRMGPSGCEGCIEDLVDLEVIVGDAPDGALQLVPRLDLLVAREVAGEDLGVDLDLRVRVRVRLGLGLGLG